MSHTPGPWRVDTSFAIPTVIAHCYPKGSTCVAVVYGDSMSKSLIARVPTIDGEAEANARLIAAAPELLKAAHAAYQALKSYQYGNAAPALAEECAVVLLNAVAKAEGRA